LWPERLELPLRWRKPRRVFVNSMSDLFHAAVPDLFIAQVFATMGTARQHTFQVLTKRPGRMRSLLSSESFVAAVQCNGGPAGGLWPLSNVWLGVSVESQKWAGPRLTSLASTPAAVRFASCEPLLGALDIGRWLDGGLDWVIAGGESGAKARPMHPGWARALRDQCRGADVPFFFKQWGQFSPIGPVFDGEDEVYDENDLALDGTGCAVDFDGSQPVRWTSRGFVSAGRPDAGSWWMLRTGKGRAGRQLDGRTWDEFPAPLVDVGACGG
jgi:protein gp37